MFSSIADALGGFFGSGAPGMAAQGGGQGFMAGLQNHLGGIFGKGGQIHQAFNPAVGGAGTLGQMAGGLASAAAPGASAGSLVGGAASAVNPALPGAAKAMNPAMMMALGQAMQGGGQQQPRMAAPGGWANQGGHNPQSMNLHNMMQMAQPLSDPYQRMQQRSLAQARLGMGRQ